MTSHSIKMERQCIFTSQFGQSLSDLNIPSKSTGRDGPIAWPPRSLEPTTLDFFFLDTQRILFTFHHFSLSLTLQLDARRRATAASCTRYLCRHDGCRAAHGDPTAYPYKCRSVEMHHTAYQIGLSFPFLCLLLLQLPYTDMVYLSRVHPVPCLLNVIRRAGPRHVDAPGTPLLFLVTAASKLKTSYFDVTRVLILFWYHYESTDVGVRIVKVFR